MGKFIDITGKRYGYLTVIKRVANKKKKVMWLCRCDCGNEKIISGNSLRTGLTKSCGCKTQALISQTKTGRNFNDLLGSRNTYDFYDTYAIGYTNKGDSFIIDLDDYDKVKNYNWYIHTSDYVVSSSERKISIHRLIMGAYDNDSKLMIDHINHDKSDNRKCNLRFVTNSQNQMNKDVGTNNSSGFRGISWHKNKNGWISQIQINGKLKYLGLFRDIKDAIAARVEAEKKYFSDFNYNPNEWNLVGC